MITFAELKAQLSTVKPRHYDSACLDLARAMLADFPHLQVKAVDLAIELQGTIEDWIGDQEQIRRIDEQVKAIAETQP